MEFEFDFSPDDLNEEYQLPECGDYVVECVEVDDTKVEIEGYFTISLRIESACEESPAGQEGLVHRERLYTTEKAARRIAKFAVAAGLVTKEQLGSGTKLDLTQAVGRKLEITLVANNYQNKEGAEVEGRQVAFLGFRAAGNGDGGNASVSPSPAPVPTPSKYADL